MKPLLSTLEDRCIGLEQEFFLVNETGLLSNRADEFLAYCQEGARATGRDPTSFAPECAKSMVEINTPPVYSHTELARKYLENLELALAVGRELGLRLYPLASYPLSVAPMIRDEPHYHLQAHTVGRERFMHAGRCAGAHLHLEVAAGTIDARVGVSYDAPKAAREELLSLYNLATALDAAIIALTRSCPFYEGIADGTAVRTAHYRGDLDFAPYGLYAQLKQVGGLLPYASSVEELVEQQFARYHAWLEAMDRAGVERQLFFETGGGLLKSSWNPVRLNLQGTVELRGIDSNCPKTILAISALIGSAASVVCQERLTVLPRKDLKAFEVTGRTLYVPDFEYLSGKLLHIAATEGIENPELVSYLDSILSFAGAGAKHSEEINLEALKVAGQYRTTEADILNGRASPVSHISEERGLELVREACDKLEEQVTSHYHRKLMKAGTNAD